MAREACEPNTVTRSGPDQQRPLSQPPQSSGCRPAAGRVRVCKAAPEVQQAQSRAHCQWHALRLARVQAWPRLAPSVKAQTWLGATAPAEAPSIAEQRTFRRRVHVTRRDVKDPSLGPCVL
eukprot:388591-Rhodomonas_salina.3